MYVVFILVLNVFLLFRHPNEYSYFLVIIKNYSNHCEFFNIINKCFIMYKKNRSHDLKMSYEHALPIYNKKIRI